MPADIFFFAERMVATPMVMELMGVFFNATEHLGSFIAGSRCPAISDEW